MASKVPVMEKELRRNFILGDFVVVNILKNLYFPTYQLYRFGPLMHPYYDYLPCTAGCVDKYLDQSRHSDSAKNVGNK